MKTSQYIATMPREITPEAFENLAQRMRAATEFESLELLTDEEDATIVGIREETNIEMVDRVKKQALKDTLDEQREANRQRRIQEVLALNPGVVHLTQNEAIKQGYVQQTSVAKALSAPEALQALAQSMLADDGVFVRNGKVLEWGELKRT